MIKEAVILAGGLGTRLKSVVKKIPKPMAPINGKPFLEYLLEYLKKNGIERVIISAGYKAEIISRYFGDKFLGIDIEYAIEKEPLGTGGGILFAAKKISAYDFFLLNGDTFFNLNLEELFHFHTNNNFDISLSLKKMKNVERYGIVEVENNKISSFKDKMFCEEGFINGGFLKLYPKKIKMGAYKSSAYFIDIGIPEDYKKANNELKYKILQ